MFPAVPVRTAIRRVLYTRAELCSQTEVLFDVDAASSKGIHSAPPPRDVQELEVTDSLGQGRIDHQVVAHRLQAEHRSDQEERSAR